MNTLIFRTIAPLLTVVMLVFSVFVLLRITGGAPSLSRLPPP